MSFIVSTETDKLDLPWLCAQIKSQYWGGALTDAQIIGAVENSLCFWIHDYQAENVTPVGFARVVTDGHIFSSIMDVFVAIPYQRQGHGTKLLQAVFDHPKVRNTICILATRDALRFYRGFGFVHFTQGVMKRDPQ